MPLTLKITVVVFCFALCGASTFIASVEREQSKHVKKMNAIPVENHQIARRAWIVAARL